jgi:hypothetical protein
MKSQPPFDGCWPAPLIRVTLSAGSKAESHRTDLADLGSISDHSDGGPGAFHRGCTFQKLTI